MRVTRGEIRRLIIELPPRHSKSETTSIKFPSYYLGKFPRRRVMLGSYSADLALKMSARSRTIFEEFGPEVFGVSLSQNTSAKDQWDVVDPTAPVGSPPGGMIAAGVGGSMTGHGYHLGIIDDPIKDAKEANSTTIRDSIWDWYRYVFRTRIMDEGAIIVMMTRWHEDDLVGRLLAEDAAGRGEGWTVLRLPALAEEDDPLGREVGQPLWPEKYGLEFLKQTMIAVGTYVWNALYQQRPSSAEGGIFKRHWWRFWRPHGSNPAQYPPITVKTPDGPILVPAVELPEMDAFDTVIQSWDMTFDDTKNADAVAGGVWAKKGANKYLLDLVWDKMDFTTTVKNFEAQTKKWPQARTKLVENKANGPAVINTLRNRISGIIPTDPKKLGGSKVSRASASSPQVEAGNVFLPHPHTAPWVWDYIEQHAQFPNGQHDDAVDQQSQALLKLDNTTGADAFLEYLRRQAR